MKLALAIDERNPTAIEAAEDLSARYGFVDESVADATVVVGGDGFMLHTLHRFLREERTHPVYGLNCGTVGFLMNRYAVEDLHERVEAAMQTELHPLEMRATDGEGRDVHELAINEVALFRASAQTARIRVHLDGRERLQGLRGDGVLLSTAAGSTAYNRSAGGPIIPLDARLLALTPIAAFDPRAWRGALLPCESHVRFTVEEAHKRPVNATADSREVADVREVEVEERSDLSLLLRFDPGHTLEGRILQEQFAT